MDKNKIVELVGKYSDCQIEELYENHEVMGNYCCITSDYQKDKGDDGEDVWSSNCLGLVEHIRKFENIKNFTNETHLDNEKDCLFYECISFEWED